MRKTMHFAAAAVLLLAATLPVRAQTSAPAAAGLERVVVGVYVTQIYDLDPTGGSFTASFWLWTRHRGGNIRPLDTIHILGAKKVESEPTLTMVKAGQVWDQKFFRAVIRFPWELREYPFDEHNFVIRFEEGLYDSETLIYIADRAQSGIDPGAMGSRWNIGSFRFDAELRRSPTTYGDPTLTKPKSYSAQGVVTVYAERRQTVIFFKLLIGAYVALLLALLSYRIKTDQPTLFSARLGLLVGSLFATGRVKSSMASGSRGGWSCWSLTPSRKRKRGARRGSMPRRKRCATRARGRTWSSWKACSREPRGGLLSTSSGVKKPGQPKTAENTPLWQGRNVLRCDRSVIMSRVLQISILIAACCLRLPT